MNTRSVAFRNCLSNLTMALELKDKLPSYNKPLIRSHCIQIPCYLLIDGIKVTIDDIYHDISGQCYILKCKDETSIDIRTISNTATSNTTVYDTLTEKSYIRRIKVYRDNRLIADETIDFRQYLNLSFVTINNLIIVLKKRKINEHLQVIISHLPSLRLLYPDILTDIEISGIIIIAKTQSKL